MKYIIIEIENESSSLYLDSLKSSKLKNKVIKKQLKIQSSPIKLLIKTLF